MGCSTCDFDRISFQFMFIVVDLGRREHSSVNQNHKHFQNEKKIYQPVAYNNSLLFLCQIFCLIAIQFQNLIQFNRTNSILIGFKISILFLQKCYVH